MFLRYASEQARLKSNFYFVLIGYFREISDYTRNKSAGEHFEPAERTFGREKGETEPELDVFQLPCLVRQIPPRSIDIHKM